MKKTNIYAVAGKPILHSLSPQLFNALFERFFMDALYTKISAPTANSIIQVLCANQILGLNITAPFKETILHHLSDEISCEAKMVGATNAILWNQSKSIAFNTDIYGVYDSIKHNVGIIESQKILVIGAGGAARAAVCALLKLNAEVVIVNRTIKNAQKLAQQFNVKYLSVEDFKKETKIYNGIVNTLEYPYSIISIDKISNLKWLLDANYKKSLFKEYCQNKYINYIDGLEWLKFHIIKVFQLFFKKSISKSDINFLHELPKNQINVISLIGMPGSGKTSVGKKLANDLGFNFIDTDELIVSKLGKSIAEIFKTEGEEKFRYYESMVPEWINQKIKKGKVVVATGGGFPINDLNLQWLNKKTMCIYLHTEISELVERIQNTNRPLIQTENYVQTLNEIFDLRRLSYLNASELIWNNTSCKVEETVNYIIEDISKSGLM